MAVIDNAYQYYLSNYGASNASRYDAHKKNQLKDIYNRIVKSNTESPLYKIKDPGEAKEFAIDIKESTRNMQHVIAALSEGNDGFGSFAKHIAKSSDENVVTAEYIGADSTDKLTGFDIQVQQLASEQRNIGNYLNPDRLDISSGTYSFDLITGSSSYEFQFSVGNHDTNKTIQNKLMKLFNNASIGLSASIIKNEAGQTALEICSKNTGISEEQDYLFQILPSAEESSIQVIDTLGIHHISHEAQNSSFLLNGVPHVSHSNNFTVNNEFDITLHGTNPNGNSSQIGFKTNSDAIVDNVRLLIDAYNNVIRIGHAHEERPNSSRLVKELGSIAQDYQNELESFGLRISDEKYIDIDQNLLIDAVSSDEAQEVLSVLGEFKDVLNEKAEDTAINPMQYVNKIIISYKNPGRGFATPYITSIYSGMMLDTYC